MSSPDSPQVLDQPGLEYYPGHHVASPQHVTPPTYTAAKEGESEGLRHRTTILGLQRIIFWLLLVLALVVVAAAVGGGVGGSLAVKSAKLVKNRSPRRVYEKKTDQGPQIKLQQSRYPITIFQQYHQRNNHHYPIATF